MRILQLIYESRGNPFGFGGAGIRAYEIYSRLKDNHDITLLCMKYPGARDGIYRGLKHIFVGIESESLFRSVLSYTVHATRFIKKHGHHYDIIVENFLPATPFCSILFTDKPVVLQIQGLMKRHVFKKFPPYYSIPMYLVERLYPLLYKNYIFVSNVHSHEFIKRARHYICIPNGINESLLKHPSVEKNYILFMSRIDTYTKGLDLLLRAFTSVASVFPDLQLLLAGSQISPLDELLRMVPEHLRTRVKYIGFVEGKDKIEVLSGAKVFVLPSRHEAHPVSLLEAFACAKPVVVSDIEELSFVKDNDIGLTFRCGSAEDLSQKLMYLLKNPSVRHALGTKARRYVTPFLWDNLSREFEQFLQSVLKNP